MSDRLISVGRGVRGLRFCGVVGVVAMAAVGCLPLQRSGVCSSTDDCREGRICDGRSSRCIDPYDVTGEDGDDTSDTEVDAGRDSTGTVDAVDASDTGGSNRDTSPSDLDVESDVRGDGCGKSGVSLPKCDELAFWLRAEGATFVEDANVGGATGARWLDRSPNGFHFQSDDDGSIRPPTFESGAGATDETPFPYVKFGGGFPKKDAGGTTDTAVDVGGEADVGSVRHVQSLRTRRLTSGAGETTWEVTKSDTLSIFFVLRREDAEEDGVVLGSCKDGGRALSLRVRGSEGTLVLKLKNRDRTVNFNSVDHSVGWYIYQVSITAGDSSDGRVLDWGYYDDDGSPVVTSVNREIDRTEPWQFNQLGANCSDDPLAGRLAEILYYESGLDPAERAAVRGYLSSRYEFPSSR